MKRKVIYILLALVIALPASAQKLYNDAISLSGVSLWQQDVYKRQTVCLFRKFL